jgi:hypothetical protein
MGRSEDLRARLDGFEGDTPADDVLLGEVLSTLDLIDALEADVTEKGVSVTNARGAVATNPSVAALAKQRSVLAQLLARLFPPEDTPGQRQAKIASHARWGRR